MMPVILMGLGGDTMPWIKKRTYFLDISFHSTKFIQGIKLKQKVKNNFIQPSLLWLKILKNYYVTKEFVRTILSPSLKMSYVHNP